MTDVAWQVRAPETAEYAKEVESFTRKRRRMATGQTILLSTVAGLSLLANVGLAGALWTMMPLQRTVPVFYRMYDDGTIDAHTRISSLPATQSEAVIRTALWNYVERREGYIWAGAKASWDLIGRMSAEPVNLIYQRWFSLKNPESPQHKIGERGQVDIARIGITFVNPKVALLRFRRTLQMYGSPPPPPEVSTWTATVEFELAENLPTLTRDIDPGGVIVTRYQIAEGSL